MLKAVIVRESVIKLVQVLTERAIKVTQRGSQAYVRYNRDGTPSVVNIPYIPDDASDEYLSAIQGFLDHEVAHVLFSDPAPLNRAAKMGSGVKQVFNIAEDAYIEREMAKRYPGSGYNLRSVGEFFLKNVTDKHLAEGKEAPLAVLLVPAMRAMAGQEIYQRYMDDGNKWAKIQEFMDKCGDYLREELPKVTCSEDNLNITLGVKRLLQKDREEPPESGMPPPPGAPETSQNGLDNSGDNLFDEPPKGAPPEKGDPGEPDEKEPTETEPEGAGESESESEPEEGEESASGADEKAAGDDEPDSEGEDPSEKEKPSEGDSEDADESEDAEDAGSAGGSASEDEPDSEEEEKGGSGSVSDDEDEGGEGEEAPADADAGEEEDSHGKGAADGAGENEDHEAPLSWSDLEKASEKGFDDGMNDAISEASVAAAKEADYVVYTRDYDVIEPLEVPESLIGSSVVNKMVDAVDHMIGPLQKDLERAVAARSAAVWSAGHRSGKLNAGSLARLTAFKDDRAFRRKHENKSRDVAVSLLIDCSGSMYGEQIQTAAYAAYGLSSVLERLNISNEVIGFTTKGSMGGDASKEASRTGIRYSRVEPIYMPVFKEYSERMTKVPKARIASMISASWLANNVDGECVQYAAMRLARRPEARKILIVLSDGAPVARTMTGREVLDQHLRQVVKELVKDRIEVLGVGICSRDVRRYYPKSVVLNDLRDLPTSVIAEVKKLLTQP